VIFKLGIDVGGTFTDFFLWGDDGKVETFKVLSTPEDPSIGVLEGIRTMAQSKGLLAAEFAARIRTIVHGTCRATGAPTTRRSNQSLAPTKSR
jgi:N-methylhydantoinase A